MFGKVEFFWCHVIKCASSLAERALTLTLTGLHTGENQELVVRCWAGGFIFAHVLQVLL